MNKVPDVRRFVAACASCYAWQVDMRPGAVSDVGGSAAALQLFAAAHVEHLEECVGSPGRVRVAGKWVDSPALSDGGQPDGMVELVPVPPWWVTR